jgi:hypothetical protein
LGLTNADNILYNTSSQQQHEQGKKKMEMNKNMSQMINHYLYGVGCPVGVSYSRWAGIVKFFEKNFGFLPDPA